MIDGVLLWGRVFNGVIMEKSCSWESLAITKEGYITIAICVEELLRTIVTL